MIQDGTGHQEFADEANSARLVRRWQVEEDTITWRHELHPEIMEVFASKTPEEIISALQTARATMDEWIADLYARLNPPTGERFSEETLSAQELQDLGAFQVSA